MTSQAKNIEAKKQPDLPWAENTENSHNQLKNLDLNPFLFVKKGGSTNTCIFFFLRPLISFPVILRCFCSNYCNMSDMINFDKIWKIYSSYLCDFFFNNISFVVLLQSHKILWTSYLLQQSFAWGFLLVWDLQMDIRWGRMFIVMIVYFPHNDNNNLSHLSKSNLIVFMSGWRHILIKSCSCTGIYFSPFRDHLNFQFSI